MAYASGKKNEFDKLEAGEGMTFHCLKIYMEKVENCKLGHLCTMSHPEFRLRNGRSKTGDCNIVTLNFLISVGLCLLIFGIFSRVYGLIREPTLIEFGQLFFAEFFNLM